MLLPFLANLPVSNISYTLFDNYAVYDETKIKPIFYKDSEWDKTSSNMISLWQNQMEQGNDVSTRNVFLTDAAILHRVDRYPSFEHESSFSFTKKARKVITLATEFSGYRKNKLTTAISDNVLVQ